MKITGFKKENTELEGCMVLSDIGIAASPDTLRDLAAFLLAAADEMEKLGEDYDHTFILWMNGISGRKIIPTSRSSVKNIFNKPALIQPPIILHIPAHHLSIRMLKGQTTGVQH